MLQLLYDRDIWNYELAKFLLVNTWFAVEIRNIVFQNSNRVTCEYGLKNGVLEQHLPFIHSQLVY